MNYKKQLSGLRIIREQVQVKLLMIYFLSMEQIFYYPSGYFPQGVLKSMVYILKRVWVLGRQWVQLIMLFT